MADVVQMHDHAGRSHGVIEDSDLERFVARDNRDATRMGAESLGNTSTRATDAGARV